MGYLSTLFLKKIKIFLTGKRRCQHLEMPAYEKEKLMKKFYVYVLYHSEGL